MPSFWRFDAAHTIFYFVDVIYIIATGNIAEMFLESVRACKRFPFGKYAMQCEAKEEKKKNTGDSKMPASVKLSTKIA